MTRVLLEENEWRPLKELLSKGIWLIKVRRPLTSKSSVFFYRDYHPAQADFRPEPILEKVVSLANAPELMEPDLAEIEIITPERKKYLLGLQRNEARDDEIGGDPVAIARIYSFGVQENRPRIYDQSFLLLKAKEGGEEGDSSLP